MENKFPTVISFYTIDTPYQLFAHGLTTSCEKFNIAHCVEGIPSFGSWELNCGFKPLFIRHKLLELKKPVLWVDADAAFAKRPCYIEEFKADLATRIHFDWEDDFPSKVITGTVYVNYTQKAIDLLDQWTEECKRSLFDSKRTRVFWDQIALRDVLFRKKQEAKVLSLPLSYCKIAGHPDDTQKIEDPVIEHFQASRAQKNSS